MSKEEEPKSIFHYLQMLNKKYPDFKYDATDIPTIIIETIYFQPELYNILLHIDMQLEQYLIRKNIEDNNKNNNKLKGLIKWIKKKKKKKIMIMN